MSQIALTTNTTSSTTTTTNNNNTVYFTQLRSVPPQVGISSSASHFFFLIKHCDCPLVSHTLRILHNRIMWKPEYIETLDLSELSHLWKNQRMSWFVFYPGASAVSCRIALTLTCFDTFHFRRANSVARMSALYVAICEFLKISSSFDYLLVGFSMLPPADAVVDSPNQYTLFLCCNCQNVSVEWGVLLWKWTRTNLRYSDVAVALTLLLHRLPHQLL